MKLIHTGTLFLSLLVVAPASAWAADAATDDAASADATAGAADTDEAAPAAPAAAPAAEAAALPEATGPKRAPNSVNFELLGAGILYSINYERLVLEELGVRVGLMYMSVSASAGTSSASVTNMIFPLEVSYLGVGSPHHMLELGGGASLAYTSGSASSLGRSSSGSGIALLPNVLVGYRLHPVDGAGFQFRIGMQVFGGKGLGFDVEDPTKFGILPWPYLSLGASF